MRRTSIIVVLVVATLAAVVVGSVATVEGAENPTVENGTVDNVSEDQPEPEPDPESTDPGVGVTDDGEELTLEELRNGGTQPSGSPSSVRIAGEQMFWVVHWPSNTFGADVGDPEDDDWRYLERGELVDRNSVWLRTIRTETGQEDLTIRVAYYDIGEREIERGDEAVVEEYPENLVVDEVNATVHQGWVMEEVSLRQSEDERYVTMWVDGSNSDELRWTFRHDSVATTESAGVETEGDYLYRAGVEFLLPIFLGTFLAGGACKRAIDRAGAGPQWGYLKWLIVLVVGTALIVGSQYRTVADLMTIAPYVAAAFIVGVISIVILESYVSNLRTAEFVRPELDDAVSPSGETARDMVQCESTVENIVKLPDGRTAVVRPGLLPFLSRCFGGAAIIEGSERIKTTVNVTESHIDEKYFVHPRSEDVIDYEPESWTVEVPTIEDRDELLRYGIATAVLVLIGASVAMTLATGWGLAVIALGAVAMMARPTMGYARIEPAPAHLRSAWASMMYLSTELEEAETIEEARKKNIELEARNERDVEEALEQQDSTLVEEMFNTDADRAVTSDVEDLAPEQRERITVEEVEADD